MLKIMFYEIYFIKHYFFRFIRVNNFILSHLRPTPTTDLKKVTVLYSLRTSMCKISLDY